MRYLLYILAIAMLAVASCTTTKYVPVESVRTEKEYLDRLRIDSIYISDSVYIKEKGDTIFKEHLRYVYRNRYVHDTAFMAVTDTIQVPYPVPTPLTRWQKLKQELGGTAIGILLAVAIFGVIRLVRRGRN